jgi:SAM-dependent methyltransferase
MALVAKEAWAFVGGYQNVQFGWEDYDFWCRFAEQGLRGIWVKEVCAEYRVHAQSMLRTTTEHPENKRLLLDDMKQRHPWLALVDAGAPLIPARVCAPKVLKTLKPPANRLELLLPHLRCPESGSAIRLAADGSLYVPETGRRWPVVDGRPILYPGMDAPEVKPENHVSNSIPESALAIIKDAHGLVLNLSAGGTERRYDHVIEVEAAIFRHTDAVIDAHRLPFADETYDAVIALNAFEHYRDPRRVATEIFRILRPAGRLLVRTAFLQPQHEAPWHFYNCTRIGLQTWLDGFECDTLHVSDNFAPNHAISWLASDCEAALRRDLSAAAAEEFAATPMGDFVRFWRNPASGNGRWTDFTRLSQKSQEAIAAGFEFVGRKPRNRDSA